MNLPIPITQLVRFATVGVANTVLTLAIITLALAAGLGDFPANFLGYCAGLTLSYVANRRWTFSAIGRVNSRELLRYLACFIVAYAGNLAVLGFCRALGLMNTPIAHLPGMITYTLMFFVLADRFAFRSAEDTTGQSVDIRKIWPELLLLVVAVITFAAIATVNLTHDVTWQLWIARQILHGARLYVDIWELNPPLWFWSAIPIEWISVRLNINAMQLLIATVVALGTISAMLVGRLSERQPASQRFVLMLACFWFSVPMALFDFGQREQLALIVALPYAALIASRKRGEVVALPLVLAIALMAAFGFALKHYFIAVPAVLEAWLFMSQRRRYTPFRPELGILAVCAVAYAVAVLIWAPAFLSRIVPMVAAAYHGYEVPTAMLFDEPAQVIWVLGLVALLIYRRLFGENGEPLAAAWFLTALAFSIAYFAQQKGWQYHAIPVTGALLAAIAARASADGVSRIAKYPLGILVVTLAVLLGILQGPYSDFLRRETDGMLKSVPPGEAVAMLQADPMFTWPIIEEYGLRWPLHVYSYWMLPAIGNISIKESNPALTGPLSDTIIRQTNWDLRCDPPALILIERMEHSYSKPRRYFNVRQFFLSDPEINAFIHQGYREEAGTRLFAAYRRIRAPVYPKSPACTQYRTSRISAMRR